MTKYNKTERFLQRKVLQFKKTRSGIGAFLPTVKEYRGMSKADQRFLQRNIATLQKKTPYRKERDLSKANATSAIIKRSSKYSNMSLEKKMEFNDRKSQLWEVTAAKEAQELGVLSRLSGRNRKIRNRDLQREKNFRTQVRKEEDYLKLQQLETLDSRFKLRTKKQPKSINKNITAPKGRLNKRSVKFQFDKSMDSMQIKDKLLTYEAYQKNEGVIIYDPTKPAKRQGKGKFVAYSEDTLENVLRELGQIDDTEETY